MERPFIKSQGLLVFISLTSSFHVMKACAFHSASSTSWHNIAILDYLANEIINLQPNESITIFKKSSTRFQKFREAKTRR